MRVMTAQHYPHYNLLLAQACSKYPPLPHPTPIPPPPPQSPAAMGKGGRYRSGCDWEYLAQPCTSGGVSKMVAEEWNGTVLLSGSYSRD